MSEHFFGAKFLKNMPVISHSKIGKNECAAGSGCENLNKSAENIKTIVPNYSSDGRKWTHPKMKEPKKWKCRKNYHCFITPKKLKMWYMLTYVGFRYKLA